jgi:sec-independent protein translocase protein TatB
MLDLAWSELALIAVIAVVVIGPKDLPDAIRTVAKGVKKLRGMAAEFQTHADELVKEAKLEDVRQQIQDIRNFDLKGTITRAVDSDGDIQKTFSDNPLKDAWKPTPEGGQVVTEAPPAADTVAAAPDQPIADAPAFIPPTVAAFNADAERDHPMPQDRKPEVTPPQAEGAAAPEKPAAPPATPTV